MKTLLSLLMASSIVTHAADDSVPPELLRLKEQRAQKVADIDKIYLKQLKLLQAKFMKRGDLDGANSVAMEIKKISPDAGEELEVETTRWTWASGGILVLRADGVATHSRWKEPGRWRKLADGNIRLTSGNNRMTFNIELKSDSFGVVMGEKGKGGTTITLIK